MKGAGRQRPWASRFFAYALLAGLAAGCASAPESVGSDTHAELAFARSGSPGGLPGRFTRVDGKAVAGDPVVLQVRAGRRTIEYNCPDTITLDAYPTVRADFSAGQRYVLECAANAPGTVAPRASRP